MTQQQQTTYDTAAQAAIDRELVRLVHEVGDGRWIVAYWSDRHQQWQSSDRKPGYLPDDQGYSYTYGRSLDGLASAGIATYATRENAERAAREVYGITLDEAEHRARRAAGDPEALAIDAAIDADIDRMAAEG